MGYAIAAFFGFVTAVLVLSAFSPEHSTKPFWRAVHRIKDAMDSVTYVFLTACLVLTAAAAAVYAALHLLA